MANILTIGEILVEMMATRFEQPFDQTGEYSGPHPSGAPAIFIDQAARTGSRCRMVSKVGNDGFGKINLDRLRADGVDVRHIGIVPDKVTGIAFVTYKENGDRNFIFTTKDSAAAAISREDVHEELFRECRYFHFVGCSIFNAEMMAVFRKAVALAKAHQVQISFDPNIRKEIMDDPEVRDVVKFAVASCDIFLPGEDELRWITGIEDEERAVDSVFEGSARLVIVKRGKRGCRVYERSGFYDVAPFDVEEVDPTGAGDCFAGTLISLLNQGKPLETAIAYANAAGAYAVTQKGPMAGTATLAELEAFIREKSGSDRQ